MPPALSERSSPHWYVARICKFRLKNVINLQIRLQSLYGSSRRADMCILFPSGLLSVRIAVDFVRREVHGALQWSIDRRIERRPSFPTRTATRSKLRQLLAVARVTRITQPTPDGGAVSIGREWPKTKWGVPYRIQYWSQGAFFIKFVNT